MAPFFIPCGCLCNSFVICENATPIHLSSEFAASFRGALQLESGAIEVHMSNLRKKIGAERICTVRGVGYMLGK